MWISIEQSVMVSGIVYVFMGFVVCDQKKNPDCLEFVLFRKARQRPPKLKIPLQFKKRFFSQYILPVYTYGRCETWTISKKMGKRLINASHTAMERKMLNIEWHDHISNKTVKEKSKLPEMLTTIMKQKWKWTGRVARMNNHWAHDIMMWKPGQGKRNRPCAEEIHKHLGKMKNWTEVAKDRNVAQHGEGLHPAVDSR